MKTFKVLVNEVEVNYLQNYKTDLPFQAYKEAAELYADERVKEERGKIAQYIMERYDIIPNSIDMRELSDTIKNRKP